MKTSFINKIISAVAALALFANSAHALQISDFTLSGSRPERPQKMVSAADGTFYYQMTDNSKIEKIDYKTGKSLGAVFDSSTARNCSIKSWDGFIMSEDESKILLYTNVESIYRYSFKAEYYVFEVKRNNMKPLTAKGQVEIATFSPDARMVGFVYENNIYLKKLDYDTEVAVTTDGKIGEIINGVPDWVYQEEFGMLNSLAFSSDNTTLSYLKWNERDVPTYTFPIYEGVCNRHKEYSKYPGEFSYKYPVAGEANSIVTVNNYDVETRKTKQIKLPDNVYYIANIKYAPSPDRLMVMTLNRDQNSLQLFAVNPKSTVSKLVYTDNSDSWINVESVISMTRYYDNYFIIASERSGFNHLYKYANSGSLIGQITKGDWQVTQYYGHDAITNTYYFQTTQDGPLNRTVSSLNAKGIMTKLSKETGWNQATFNSTFTYYLLDHSELNKPNQYTFYNAKGIKLRTILDNKEYADKYCSPEVPKREFFTCMSDGNQLNGYMIKPVDFNSSKKYPVILSQYSGPSSQMVKNQWKLDWEQYAAMNGYIVVCVDGRGTGFRGKAWESVVYMQLGKYESIDQIAVAKYMASQSYVDSSKIGIYGWSFGGYETLMAMSQKNSPFAAGVAVAPVTDWRFYDTIYTERFMRTPQQNEDGYNCSSAINAIPNLKGRLLIMAGTADDNVHISNTYQYCSELTAQHKICDMMVYPNMNHSINGCDVRSILYKRILDHFDTYLKL